MQILNHNNFNLKDFALTAHEFLLKRKESPRPLVLDLRALDVIEQSGLIEGTHALPFSELEERLIQLPPFGTIILYSDLADTNIAEAVKLLWENGFSDMYYVVGGYAAVLGAFIEWEEGSQPKVYEFLKSQKQAHIQMEIKDGDYILHYIDQKPNSETYREVQYGDFSLFFPHAKFRVIEGLKLGFKDGKPYCDHPRMHMPKPKGTLKERVQQLLDEEINPSVASHGGFVKLIEIEDDTAYIEMGGGCQGCGMSAVTLKQGVESAIFNSIPEISRILDTTDHAAGTNPYYQPS